jgi:F-type H+-transporting ATPase subunit b
MTMLLTLVTQEGGAGGGSLLTVDGGLVIWTLVVFGLLFFTLRKYAWPELLRAVEAREKALLRMLDEAEKNRTESLRLLEEHKKLLAGAKSEAQEIITKAKQVADKEREALLAKARHEQDDLLARARKEIGEEKQKALLALRKEAVDLALAAAAKLVEQTLDSEANRRLVTEYLESLEKTR